MAGTKVVMTVQKKVQESVYSAAARMACSLVELKVMNMDVC